MPVVVAQEFIQSAVTLMEAAAVRMANHRDNAYPQEAVGILCSNGDSYSLINQARSGHRFEVSEVLVKEAIEILESRDMEPVAMYHSHPTSAASPSGRDVSMMMNMPGALSIIVGIDGIAAWLWDDVLQSVGRIPLPERTRHVESA